ncbi:carbohydrate kinase [Jiulongibacter sediminis]|jgi:fructokinase|uniref:carbohydrate kinase family protein n=1 Tax=Jiulongibacter sediminis TaxID=1605367 RepID=UPI0026ED6065|nr:carbohydrate kinase [Jiulongibacter sediminis]
MKNRKLNTVCFGEMLWDVLPETKQVGGAPLNVAFHLQSLGCNSHIVSKVGDDTLGKELLDFLRTRNLSTEYVQQGKAHLTGVAKANISDKSEVTYKILHPVAYDYIELNDKNKALAEGADVFIYGSLAARNQVTLSTLLRLLTEAKFKVFDVNLRAPFYNREIIEKLLQTADLIKLNEHEVEIISSWLSLEGTEENKIKGISKMYGNATVCLTRGDKGALLYLKDQLYYQTGYSVEVKDTIGSGDAFLAALIYMILSGKSANESLAYACGLGSLVATYQGATPAISFDQIEEFISTNLNTL